MELSRVVRALVVFASFAVVSPAAAVDRAQAPGWSRPAMSPQGSLAAQRRAQVEQRARVASPAQPGLTPSGVRVLGPPPEKQAGGLSCGDEPACEGVLHTLEGQAETSIAVSRDGRHVVVGFNDNRGFNQDPVSVSGFRYSDDEGRTFVDGHQLPTPGDVVLGGQRFPQIYGDPDVKWLGACNYVYASILLTVTEYLPGVPTVVQTLSVHRSRDCGHTWEGPFEVTAASNPNGYIYSDGSPVDAADKEFSDYDARTGRLVITWTNFTHPLLAPSGIQMMSTTCDDVMAAGTPTFSTAGIISAAPTDGQASIPRFGSNGRDVYVTWRRSPGGGTNVIAFAHSGNGGATWDAPTELSAPFFVVDQVLGNDRVNSSPSLAVAKGRHHADTLYVVYANNDSRDGADIAFQASRDQGQTWSAPVFVNSRPGDDRAQWFPWVAVDDDTHRMFVFYYDQGVATSGDLSQATYTYSDNDGRTWSEPAALSDRTFHAGWGNDTGQPNLGDYNQAVAQRGRLYASFAETARPPGGFADGQPSARLTVPDVAVQVLPNADHPFGALPLDLVEVELRDSGHSRSADPGERFTLRLTLRNSDTNPLSAGELEDLVGTLASRTPGVTVLSNRATWRELEPGEAGTNVVPFVLRTRPGFAHGTPIELELTMRGEDHAKTTLRTTIFTGTPLPQTLLSENFDASSSLPPGWLAAHGAGANVVRWYVSTATLATPGFCGSTSNGAFHANADDGLPGGSPSRWERLISPSLTVPADSEYVTVEFDVCYDTEDEPAFRVQAYDGFFLRVTDLTPGRTLRSVLAEAFQDEFSTGDIFHYPKHLPRSSNPAYFANMSAWAGDSGGMRHVKLRLPGMAGSTFQLRFEFTQDGYATCADVRPGHSCGVLLDNVVIQSVRLSPSQP